MKKTFDFWPLLTPMLFGISVYIFWYGLCPCILSYHEQLQMFLFSSDYFIERVSVPGGFSRYLAEFIIQFGNTLYAALVMTIFFVLFQQLTWQSIKKDDVNSRCWNALSALPALLSIAYMGDENMSFTSVVCVMLATACVVVYKRLGTSKVATVFLFVSLPIIYWLIGPAVLVFALFVSIYEIIVHKRYSIAFAVFVLTLSSIFLSSFFVAYPHTRLFLGINYYRAYNTLPLLQVAIMFFAAVLPFVEEVFITKARIRKGILIFSSVILVCVLFVLAMKSTYVPAKLEILKYDYLVRQQRWDEIIREAEKRNPSSPLTVASLNLALAMKGQQNERAMQFYQNGWEGAFPTFNKNYEPSIILSEVYYYLGMVNMSQMFCFEAMEAIPDNNKSGRMFKRLAETNLINGQYDVAEKYLNVLKKTLGYDKWAETTSLLLRNETAINNHPVYGYLRKMRLDTDFLYTDKEIDKIMGQLLMHNKNNYVAAQYLLLLPKLEGNQQKYRMYLDYVNSLGRK